MRGGWERGEPGTVGLRRKEGKWAEAGDRAPCWGRGEAGTDLWRSRERENGGARRVLVFVGCEGVRAKCCPV